VIIKHITTTNFGKFPNYNLDFSSKLNIIYEPNISDKDINLLIKTALFGMSADNSKDFKDKLYRTPNSSDDYKISLTFEIAQSTYKINRVFSIRRETLSLINLTLSMSYTSPSKELANILKDISASDFSNILNIYQLDHSVSTSMLDELNKHVMHSYHDGNFSSNINNSIVWLEKQKGIFTKQLDLDANINYSNASKQIENLENEISYLPNIKKEIAINNAQAHTIEVLTELDNTNAKISEILSDITSKLEEFQISSVDDISQEYEKFQNTYNEYLNITNKKSFHLKSTPQIMLLASSMLFLGVAIYFYIQQNFIYGGLSSVVTVVLSFILQISIHKNKKYLNSSLYMANYINDLILRFIGEDTITNDTINNLDETFKSIINLKTKFIDFNNILNANISKSQILQSKLSQFSKGLEIIKNFEVEIDQRHSAIILLSKECAAACESIQNNKILYQKIKALDLALSTFKNISSKMHNYLGIYLNTSVSDYMHKLTNGKINKIILDNNLQPFIKINNKLISTDYIDIAISRQIYLALRLSIVDFLYSNKTVPIILNDSLFAHDNKYLNITLNFFSKNYNRQVFLFTSNKCEIDKLNKNEFSYKLINL
jgi:Uncharacterized conserved protein